MKRIHPITEYGKLACSCIGFAAGIMVVSTKMGLLAIAAFIVLGLADVIICDVRVAVDETEKAG